MYTQLGVFVLAMVWELVGVWGTRAFAAQSVASLPIAFLLMALWIAGVNVSRDRKFWPALLIGAVGGAAIGITWP